MVGLRLLIYRSVLMAHFPKIEPLSVGTHALNTLGKLKANESVIVFGAGPIGLVCMAVARALGAKRIIAVDIVPSRLEFAKAYAATDVYLPPPMEPGEDKLKYTDRNVKVMREQLGIEERGPRSIDLVIEASGAEVSIRTGMFIVRMGGRYVQVCNSWSHNGLPWSRLIMLSRLVWVIQRSLFLSPCSVSKSSRSSVPSATAYVLSSVYHGIRTKIVLQSGDYELAIGLVAAGKIDLKPLITHRFSFQDAKEAFAANRAGKGPDGKPVIKAIISGPDVSPAEH